MSHENYNIDILRFQDKSFRVKSLSQVVICDGKTNVFEVEKEKPEVCCCFCGSVDILIQGYYVRTIKYLEMAGFNTVLKYRQRRYRCKTCGKTFNETNSLAVKNSIIANEIKIKALEECRLKQSFKDVGKRLNIATSTVIDDFSDHIALFRNKLTPIMCFDEFKASTDDGLYAFILADPLSGEIVDILPSRTQDYLFDYFSKAPDEERLAVRYIVTDLFESYRTIVKSWFWKSIHIADRFHWIRQASDAMNDLRIRVMNAYKNLGMDEFKGKHNEYSAYCYMLKKYAKLVTINPYNREDWFFDQVNHVYYLDRNMTTKEIIEYLVNQDADWEEGYCLLLNLYKLSKLSTFETAKAKLLNWIEEVNRSNRQIKEFKRAALTYHSWINEIVNSFIINPETHKRMSNGFIEGKNNYCKVIKRIGFGFKDFETFRAKILYTNAKNKLPFKN